jgi:hypothetical protein
VSFHGRSICTNDADSADPSVYRVQGSYDPEDVEAI